jgi:hypothetical protein
MEEVDFFQDLVVAERVVAGERLILGMAGERRDHAVISLPPVVGTPPARSTGAGLAKPTGSVKRLASATLEESG